MDKVMVLKGAYSNALCHTEMCTSKGVCGVGQGKDSHLLSVSFLNIAAFTESLVGNHVG